MNPAEISWPTSNAAKLFGYISIRFPSANCLLSNAENLLKHVAYLLTLTILPICHSEPLTLISSLLSFFLRAYSQRKLQKDFMWVSSNVVTSLTIRVLLLHLFAVFALRMLCLPLSINVRPPASPCASSLSVAIYICNTGSCAAGCLHISSLSLLRRWHSHPTLDIPHFIPSQSFVYIFVSGALLLLNLYHSSQWLHSPS